MACGPLHHALCPRAGGASAPPQWPEPAEAADDRADFENVRRIDAWPRSEAERWGIPAMLYEDNRASFIEALERVGRNGRVI